MSGTTHNGLDLPTHKEKALQTCLQASIMETFSQLRVLFPSDSIYVKAM